MLLGQTALSGTGGQRIAVTSLSWNPAFSDELLGSDVALVHLAHAPVAPVAPAALIDTPVVPGTLDGARTLGWGSTRLDDEVQILPDELRMADLTILDDATCAAKAGFPYAGSTMLCAMDDISGRSTCFGDSGGPLLVGDQVSGWRVAGVTSWGLVCGSKISPSVFADVLALRSWIDSSPPPRTDPHRQRLHQRPPARGPLDPLRRPGHRRHRHRRPLDARGRPDRQRARATGCVGPMPGRRWPAPSRPATPAVPSTPGRSRS